MANFTDAANRLLTCPFDETHRLKKSREQLHITRCRLKHPESDIEVCKFNFEHVVPKSEINHHHLTCSDNKDLLKAMSKNPIDNNPINHESYYISTVVESEDCWDTEISTEARPGYRPQKEAPAIAQPDPYMTRSQKKRFYENLHRRPEELKEKHMEATERANADIQTRQPTVPSEAQKVRNDQHFTSQLGLGRGSVSNRIAANIFGQDARQTNSGFHHSPDDFPALGLGRASRR